MTTCCQCNGAVHEGFHCSVKWRKGRWLCYPCVYADPLGPGQPHLVVLGSHKAWQLANVYGEEASTQHGQPVLPVSHDPCCHVCGRGYLNDRPIVSCFVCGRQTHSHFPCSLSLDGRRWICYPCHVGDGRNPVKLTACLWNDDASIVSSQTDISDLYVNIGTFSVGKPQMVVLGWSVIRGGSGTPAGRGKTPGQAPPRLAARGIPIAPYEYGDPTTEHRAVSAYGVDRSTTSVCSIPWDWIWRGLAFMAGVYCLVQVIGTWW